MVRNEFGGQIQETQIGLCFGLDSNTQFSMDNALLLIREAFVDGVIAARLKSAGLPPMQYFKND
jgi:hypothetical protein